MAKSQINFGELGGGAINPTQAYKGAENTGTNPITLTGLTAGKTYALSYLLLASGAITSITSGGTLLLDIESNKTAYTTVNMWTHLVFFTASSSSVTVQSTGSGMYSLLVAQLD